jgi:nucleoid DNA-binding protein
MILTKSDLIEQAYQMANLKKADATQAVENTFEKITSSISAGITA